MTRRALTLVLLPFLLAGCGLFSHTPSRFFTLEGIAPSGGAVAATGLPVGLDVMELPPGMDRKEIVVRKPDHQLEVRATDQWTASLQPLAMHVLAVDLSARLPQGMVVLPGEGKPARMRAVDVMIEDFSPGPDRSVTIDAQWTVREPGKADVTRHEHIATEIASLDSVNIATGLSTALGTLADRMAAGLAGR